MNDILGDKAIFTRLTQTEFKAAKVSASKTLPATLQWEFAKTISESDKMMPGSGYICDNIFVPANWDVGKSQCRLLKEFLVLCSFDRYVVI
jgi:hypothetical protein